MRSHERDKRLSLLLLLLGLIIGLSVWRFSFLQLGPDVDTDSYGHHAISRQLLITPALFPIHWVWLPLFHYVQAIAIYFGATLQSIRWANMVAVALLPVLLFAILSSAKKTHQRTAFVACALTAASPIVQQMGTTGQPEPMFALLVLSFVWAMDRNRYILAGAALGAAALVRYEAWAVIVATAGWLLLEWMTPAMAERANRPPRAWLVLFMATSAIVFWAILRWPGDGRWFAFLNQTRAFANDAVGASSSFSVGVSQFVTDVAHYTAHTPWRLMGPILLIAPFGVRRVFQTHGPWFFGASLGCLGFITLSWITRSSLGLDRHVFIVVPFYATLVAHGVESIVDFVNRLVKRMTNEEPARALGNVTFAALVIACAAIQMPILEAWMHEWGGALAHGLPGPQATAAFLDRELGGGPTPVIFCDESTVEILTNLDRRAFDRHQLDDPKTLRVIRRAKARTDTLYVVTWMSKLTKLSQMGKVIYQSPEATETSGLGVMRIDGPATE